MPKPSVHVAPNGKQWGVKKSGSTEPSSTHRTKAEAEKKGRELAKAEESELVIHGKDGRFAAKR